MTVTINGSGTITGVSAGGLPDGTITAADLAAGAARANFGAGAVLQVNSTTLTTVLSTTSTTYTDATGLSVSITPTSATSKILVLVNVSMGPGSAVGHLWQLVRGTTPIDIGTSGYSVPATGGYYTESGTNAANAWVGNASTFLDAPSSTSTLTYKVQYKAATGGTVYINRRGAAADMNMTSSITVMEIAA